MAKPNSYVLVSFMAPVADAGDRTQIKAAYEELADQILAHAKALEKDKNVIILDSIIVTTPTEVPDYFATRPVNVDLANRMATRTFTNTLKGGVKPTPTPAPVKNTKEEPAAEEPERPVVVAEPIPVKATAPKPAAAPEAVVAKVAAPAAPPADDLKVKITEKIFEDLKRTQKSIVLVDVFAKNPGVEITTEDIRKASGLTDNDVNSWLNQTGTKIKALTKPGRGRWKLDVDLLFPPTTKV